MTQRTTYTLTSVKGHHATVIGYREACRRARDIQATIQAAYGVDVIRPDGSVAYTAGSRYGWCPLCGRHHAPNDYTLGYSCQP